MIKINNENDILNFLQSQGMINLNDVREKMKQLERQRILEEHPYSIFQDKDGRWKTTVKDEMTKTGRRLIARQSRGELCNAIIQFYLIQKAHFENQQEQQSSLFTLRTAFGEWLYYKSKHSSSTSYARRIKNDWNKYYEHDEIVDIPIADLTFIKLDTWAHDLVKEKKLTKKQYYNLTVIIRQMLDYLVEKDVIELNPFHRVKIDNKLFASTSKLKSNTQVFDTSVETKIKQLALQRYNQNNHTITPLAILLNFNLGLRVGELVAIKWSNIEGHYIHIENMEVAKYIVNENGDVARNGCEVVEYVKTDAGVRDLYLNAEAMEILSIIKKRSMEYGYYDGDYVFVSSQTNSRLTTSSINKYLYGLCDEIDTLRKSSHKIRKTYISSLFDNRKLNFNKIREIAGHEDEKTSLNNYCFDRNIDCETENALENLHENIFNDAM